MQSNEWSGKNSFFGRSLHHLDPSGSIRNPYEDAAMVLARALASFDDDNLIPAYGFGDGERALHHRPVAVNLLAAAWPAGGPAQSLPSLPGHIPGCLTGTDEQSAYCTGCLWCGCSRLHAA